MRYTSLQIGAELSADMQIDANTANLKYELAYKKARHGPGEYSQPFKQFANSILLNSED